VKRALLILALTAFAKAQTIEAVLNRMDQASKTFESLSADVHHVNYAAVFDETNTEDGNFKMMKRGKNEAVLLAKFTGRDERSIFIQKGKIEIYHPKANSEDVYDTHSVKSADSLIMVGFGTSRAELQARFSIAYGAPEKIAGKQTSRLDLTPKSKEEKKIFHMIQLWIPDGEGNPIQEKVLSGTDNKDYNILIFNNLKINPKIPASDFELKLPPGVKQITAGK
jgi:outer membrane lipoprotein-sorting protein